MTIRIRTLRERLCPQGQAAIKAAAANSSLAGGKTTAIEGDPPKNRVVIQQWDRSR